MWFNPYIHEGDCSSEPKCVNCGESHPSWSKDCHVFQKEKEIEKIRNREKVPYRQAEFLLKRNENLTSHHVTYANACSNNNNHESILKQNEVLSKQNEILTNQLEKLTNIVESLANKITLMENAFLQTLNKISPTTVQDTTKPNLPLIPSSQQKNPKQKSTNKVFDVKQPEKRLRPSSKGSSGSISDLGPKASGSGPPPGAKKPAQHT